MNIYRDGQPVAVSIFENAINNDKLSHAYLIDVNNYSKAFDLILCFVKEIVCINLNEDEKRDLCARIDNGNYTELKVIEPEGNIIKKEQMLNLQDNFSLKGIEGSKRIYIIKECERMNIQTCNSILKFLEEPEENIIAILMSNNVSLLLDTIVSRCQVIRLNSDRVINNSSFDSLLCLECNSDSDRNKFLDDKRNSDLIPDFIYFINKFENYGIETIVDVKKIWHDKFNNRYYVDIALDLWINFYYDILMFINNKNIVFFVDYTDEINNISKGNNQSSLLNKLEVLIIAKSKLKYNLNLNLFVDKLIIDLVGDK